MTVIKLKKGQIDEEEENFQNNGPTGRRRHGSL